MLAPKSLSRPQNAAITAAARHIPSRRARSRGMALIGPGLLHPGNRSHAAGELVNICRTRAAAVAVDDALS